ncbi:NXPE family member 3-like isoform X2 [Branchiostoma lanceolatum]|uniref:NXPE family member 3-like isoform X2 n=1 Tax=Branchiostoma lanceolatum TaxID=7740 RepID=UPI003453B6BA
MGSARLFAVLTVLAAVVIFLTVCTVKISNNSTIITPRIKQVTYLRYSSTKIPRLEQVTSPNKNDSKLTKTLHHEKIYSPNNTSTTPSYLEQVTCPNNTNVVVLSRDKVYHQGDVFTVRVVARDKEGRPKTCGGDFFRARLLSINGSLQSSSAGHISDHCNGTYTVQFPLYWVGGASIRIQLVHPSEAVKVLERVRETPNKRFFQCSFVDIKTKAKQTRQCYSTVNPSLPPHKLCDFSKREVNGTWLCEKPEKLQCSTISLCRWDGGKSYKNAVNLVSKKEATLFKKPYLEEELEVDPKEPIRVLETELTTPHHLPACTGNARESGASLGHWSGKIWKSSVCNVQVFSKEDIQRCLANKTVYMQGDSALLQWTTRLQAVLPLSSNTDTMASDGTPKRPPHVKGGDNSQWNISVRFQFHHFPTQGHSWNYYYDFSYTADVLDAMHGGPNTVVVLGLWAHFTAEPLEMFWSRLHAIRDAVHRLKRRSPGALVFVRTGTTRDHAQGKLEFYLLNSDWLAYQITEVIREMFRADPDVVVLDTWDMSVCQPGKDSVHPDQTMVDSQLNRLLSHICPD